MKPSRVLRTIPSLALLAASVAWVAVPAHAGDDEPVRVYTNADLEALPPIPVGQPVLTRDEADWQFVSDFLDRQRESLDADRAHELERARVESEIDARRQPEPRVLLPFYGPWLPSYAVGPGRERHRGHRLPDAARDAGNRPLRVDFSPILPLHARPDPTSGPRTLDEATRAGSGERRGDRDR